MKKLVKGFLSWVLCKKYAYGNMVVILLLIFAGLSGIDEASGGLDWYWAYVGIWLLAFVVLGIIWMYTSEDENKK